MNIIYLKLRKYCNFGTKVRVIRKLARRRESNRIWPSRNPSKWPKSQSKGLSSTVRIAVSVRCQGDINHRNSEKMAICGRKKGERIHTTVCRSVCPAVNECGSRTSNDTPASNLHALYAEWGGNLTPRSRLRSSSSSSNERTVGGVAARVLFKAYAGVNLSRAPAICVSWALRALGPRVEWNAEWKIYLAGVDTRKICDSKKERERERERDDYVTRVFLRASGSKKLLFLSVDLVSRGWLRMGTW